MKRRHILRVVSEVNSERIVFVTSANWAKTGKGTANYVSEIAQAISQRKTKASITIRVSLDEGHTSSLGLTPAINLIKFFYSNQLPASLDLQLHSIIEDKTIDKLLDNLQDEFQVRRMPVPGNHISDGESVKKIVPKKEIIFLNDFPLPVGYAKTFYSDLKVDLSMEDLVDRNVAVYQKDLYESEDGNSAVVKNKIGEDGLDFWVNHNGNVCTWGNQQLDNLFNLYEDSAEDVILGTLKDPASLSFIEKGAAYRDGIIAEVNPTTVLRSKSVNIRDYTGALLFDEERTRLYYTIRVLQDYISENRISQDILECIDKDLWAFLNLPKEELALAYHADSAYTIVSQVIDKQLSSNEVWDYLEWVCLGHYSLSETEKRRLVYYYNTVAPKHQKIEQLSDVRSIDSDPITQNERMSKSLTFMKELSSVKAMDVVEF